jgi:hypothetical protein
MKNRLVASGLTLLIMLVCTAAAPAQESPRFGVEGRFGILNVPSGGFLDVSQGNHLALGFLLSYHPLAQRSSIWNRLSVRGSFDGAGLGGQDIASDIRDKERLYLVNFSLGVDAIRTSRLDLIVHGGGAISRDHFVVEAFTPFGGAFGTGGFAGACSEGPGICDSVWNFLGNGGAEALFVPKQSWSNFFVGVDYTRFAGAKNQTMFTTGVRF